MNPHYELAGVQLLRALARWSSNVREDFWENKTPEQILAIYRAAVASKWNVTPDDWAPRQVARALRGYIPTFWESPDGKLVPTYPRNAAKVVR